jgi:hypothetical protein
MRELGLRAAIDAAAYANRSDLFAASVDFAPIAAGWAQTLRFNNSATRTVYRTDAAFVLSALTASVVGVLAVAPLYYGWWQLGRNVSLNPLEIAKAFRAPLLGGVNSNADRVQLAAVVGHKRVRYGAVGIGDEGGRAGGADGSKSDLGNHGRDLKQHRCLCMIVDDGEGRVDHPEDGATYV